MLVMLLLALALVWVLIINSWRIRRKAGRPLLDLGRPGRLVGYVGGMFSLLLAAVGVLMARLQAEPGWLLYIGFFVSLALMGFLDASTSRELRQNGVLLPQQFIPWQRIRSYTWEGERILTFETEKRWGLSPRQRLRIRPALKDAAEQILRQHMGNV
jgi:UDP-N-acetylmuramyl pentapeptide phosphotransferase/UDP-N-acetylglucosamine-1-phosphate transferase